MDKVFYIQIAVEDSLSEQVIRKIILESNTPFVVNACYKKNGATYLKERTKGFNEVSKRIPILLLTDLDRYSCPPSLIKDWIKFHRNPNFLFRIAVREVESWLLAHRSGFARFTGISEKIIDRNPESIQNPKEYLISLVSRSKKREIRDAIVPPIGSTAKRGPNYNPILEEFVRSQWDIGEAMKNSPSLERAIKAVHRLALHFS